ncbi:MAG: DUF3427 domain-containing protein [Candidatus Latescibacterota bacterium]
MLTPYEDYSREAVHGIFAPETTFTPQAGTWGLQGIVAIPERPDDWAFFVTFGQQQGDHVFDEGITQDGVLTWQSQPKQGFEDARIKSFILHDELRNSIHLFLRTKAGNPYTYLGRLMYLQHDGERERPVHFKWQILDWDLPADVQTRMDLQFQSANDDDPVPTGLVQTSHLHDHAGPAQRPRTSIPGRAAIPPAETPRTGAWDWLEKSPSLNWRRSCLWKQDGQTWRRRCATYPRKRETGLDTTSGPTRSAVMRNSSR